MNRILSFFVLFVLFVSCDHDDKFYENPVSLSDIKLLSIRADHKMLLPDGKAKMCFYITAFGIKELPDYWAQYKGVDNDTIMYDPRVVCDTFKIPEDVIPAGALKLYDERMPFIQRQMQRRERFISMLNRENWKVKRSLFESGSYRNRSMRN